jgi:phage gpG-like protein
VAKTGIVVDGLDPIIKGMESEAPKRAIIDNLTDLVLRIEGKAKQATVVDTGRLRSSITHRIAQDTGIIGTNVSYSPFAEYGTIRMAPRHMEGSTKVLTMGMFTYTVETIQPEIMEYELKVISQVEKESIGQ